MVTCTKCGVENVGGARVCRSCGNSIVASARHCVSCGRSIDFDANVCPYCGHDFRVAPQGPAKKAMSTGMVVLLYIASILVPIAGIIIGVIFMSRDDPEEKRVGKFCIILGILGILLSIGLAAVLYVMVLGFGSDGHITPTTTLIRSPVLDGVRLTFGPITEAVPWNDASFLLSDGVNMAGWTNLTSDDLDDGLGDMKSIGAKAVGSLVVTLRVTDLAGNGRIDMGDYIQLTASSFSTVVDYSFTIIYEPTDGNMASISFSG